MANTLKLCQNPWHSINRIAGEDLTAYLVVKMGTDNKTVVTATAGSRGLGTPKTPKKNGQPIAIDVTGELECIADGALAPGDKVMCGANGKVTKLTGAILAAGDNALAIGSGTITQGALIDSIFTPLFGVALTETSADGDHVTILKTTV